MTEPTAETTRAMSGAQRLLAGVRDSLHDALATLWAKPDADRAVSNWTHELSREDPTIGIFHVAMTDGTVQEIRYHVKEQRS